MGFSHRCFLLFHTSHDYLYGVLSCGFYHSHRCIFFHLSFNTLPGPICTRSGPLYLLYAEVQVFSKSTPISHLVEVRHDLDFSPTSVILRSAGSIFCFLLSLSICCGGFLLSALVKCILAFLLLFRIILIIRSTFLYR